MLYGKALNMGYKMAILKVENGNQYTGNGILDYICDDEKHNNSIIGAFACYADIETAFIDFWLVKNLYGKTGSVLYRQIIVSITESETKEYQNNLNLIYNHFSQIGWLIADKLKVQVMGAVHNNTDNLHAHYILNTVNFETGKRLRIDEQTIYELKILVGNYLYHNNFDGIYISNYLHSKYGRSYV